MILLISPGGLLVVNLILNMSTSQNAESWIKLDHRVNKIKTVDVNAEYR